MANTSTSWVNLTDQQLWQLLREGDESALTAIFDRYHVPLYNYGSKLSADSDLIKDGVQEVFIDVWRMRGTLSEEITSIKFYLYRSLRRRLQRIQGKYQLGESIQEFQDDERVLITSNEETVQIEQESRDLLRRRLRELLTQLPKRQIEALTLYYYDEFTIQEIAQLMDINEKSVRNFIHRGLTTLRQNRNWLIGSLLIFWLLLN